MENLYESKDFYLAGYLMCSGVHMLSNKKTGQQTIFVFDNDGAVQNLIDKYYRMEARINPVTYGQALRNLKSIIHSNSNINIKPDTNNDESKFSNN